MVGLIFILLLVFFLPFTVKQVEHNLEIFLFVMGIAAAIVSGVMNAPLIEKALIDPIHITMAVLVAGLVTKWCKRSLEKSISRLIKILSPRFFSALMVVVLGLASSIITAIIAAIILVIVINILNLERKSEVRLTIIACFSIGLGAALTPIGEPLSTITVSKLNEDFFYLLELIGPAILPGILIFALLTLFLVKPEDSFDSLYASQKGESYKEIFIRSGKIYLFVMGLTFLGHGFEPFIHEYVLGLPSSGLYWMNIVSSILDNATLAAAEISPEMNRDTIRAVLLGLLISGGMLIPGNIPNIIAAGKLNITSREWASFGLPLGAISMFIYFFVFF